MEQEGNNKHLHETNLSPIFTFTFIHLADSFNQSDLQLLYKSEVAHLWSN